MTIDLSPFPTLLLLQPLLAAKGRAIRSTLSAKQLKECEQIAKDTKKITDDIEDAYRSGDDTLPLLMHVLKGDRLRDLGYAFTTQCMDSSIIVTPRPAPKPAKQSKTTQAFWTTTPFQIMSAAQQFGRDLDAAAKSPLVAPIIGAAAFLGLAAGAISQLRFGNTAPLQRLVETL